MSIKANKFATRIVMRLIVLSIISVILSLSFTLFMKTIGPAISLLLLVLSGPSSFIFPLFALERYQPRTEYFLLLYFVSATIFVSATVIKVNDKRYDTFRKYISIFFWILSGCFGVFILSHFE